MGLIDALRLLFKYTVAAPRETSKQAAKEVFLEMVSSAEGGRPTRFWLDLREIM